MKILVISNNSFLNSNSNGRTLGSLLQGFDKSELLQFCVSGGAISENLISDAYQISDRQMVQGFTKRKIHAVKLPSDQKVDVTTEQNNDRVTVKHTAATMLMREAVWDLSLRKTDFLEIAKAFQPDLILYQMGANAFWIKLTLELAEATGAKVAVYTTEDYYFKDYDYFLRKIKMGPAYRLFYGKYKKAVEVLMARTSMLVANTPMLEGMYEHQFSVPTKVIMPSAGDFSNIDAVPNGKIIYAGNLGLDRHLSLIAIARILRKYDLSLDVYGSAGEDIVQQFEAEGNIRYNGFLDYSSLKKIMRGARLLLHAESFDAFYRRDVRAGFSTKITDCLASGVPFFLYAPKEVAATQYLLEEDNAFVCTEEKDLEEVLHAALFDEGQRKTVVERALTSVKENHDAAANSRRMRECLEKAVETMK